MTKLKLVAVAALGICTMFGASAASAASAVKTYSYQAATIDTQLYTQPATFDLTGGLYATYANAYSWLQAGTQTLNVYLEEYNSGTSSWNTITAATHNILLTANPTDPDTGVADPVYSPSYKTKNISLTKGTYRFEINSVLSVPGSVASGYGSTTGGAVTQVPGPIAGAGLPVLAAMGALGFFRRRKQNAA